MTDEVSGNRLNAWYDLFSRGARDWLRHNEKVRDAVRAHLPQVVAGADVLSRGHSTVRVPVRMLERAGGSSFLTPLRSAFFIFKGLIVLLVGMFRPRQVEVER